MKVILDTNVFISGVKWMKIKLSRHAKRRAKLYKIPESKITEILENCNLSKGKQEIIKKVDEFGYPLKIVIDVESDIITIITNYPFKKKVEK